MLNLNVNVVMKNVRDALVHMIERRTGDIIVTIDRRPFTRADWRAYQVSRPGAASTRPDVDNGQSPVAA